MSKTSAELQYIYKYLHMDFSQKVSNCEFDTAGEYEQFPATQFQIASGDSLSLWKESFSQKKFEHRYCFKFSAFSFLWGRLTKQLVRDGRTVKHDERFLLCGRLNEILYTACYSREKKNTNNHHIFSYSLQLQIIDNFIS